MVHAGIGCGELRCAIAAIRLGVDYTATALPVRTKALLAFATKLNAQPDKVTSADTDALRKYGFNDEQILEAVLTVGVANFTNRVSMGLGMVPDFDASKIASPPRP